MLGELWLDRGTLISGNWVWTFLVLCRVEEMRASVLEEEEPGDESACNDVCKASDDIDAWRTNDGVT